MVKYDLVLIIVDAPRGAVCNTAEAPPRVLIHSIMCDYLKIKDAFCDSPHMPSLDALKRRCCDLINVAFGNEPQFNRAIQNAETLLDLAQILFFDLSRWISFDFLEEVIKSFQPALDDVKEQIDQYKDKLYIVVLQKLRQVHASHVQQWQQGTAGLELTEIVAKYRLDSDGLRVQDLVTERDFLSQRLRIPEYMLQVLSWRPDSGESVFLIMQELQPLVRPTLDSSDVRSSLTSHGIIDIYLRGHSPDSSNSVSYLMQHVLMHATHIVLVMQLQGAI